MSQADKKSELAADLLGYHLGLSDEETRARVEAAFGSAEALAEARRAVQKSLAPLDLDDAPEPPAHLVNDVLRRVSEAKRVTAPKLPRLVGADRGLGMGAGRSTMTKWDLMALAAAIALFVGVFVPGYRTARMAAQQTACANNLRQIGNGYAAYAEMFGSQWPYSGPMPVGASWLKPADAGVPYSSNSRHVFQLVRGRFVPPTAFICPGRKNDACLSEAMLDQCETFPEPRNISYATNFVTSPWRSNEFDGQMPLAGDMNPVAEEARPRIDVRLLPANSRSHGTPGGQNVLRANVSVRFFRNPNVGLENDDIYRLVGVQEYTGLERPMLRSDTFLIP